MKLAPLLSLLLASCGPSIQWQLRHVPTTPEEHKELTRHIECVAESQKPAGLAGSDQDWEDVIETIYRDAPDAVCRPTLWKLEDGSYTGEWKYTNEEGKKP